MLVKEKKIGRKIDSVPDPDNGRVLCTDGIRTAPNVYIYIYMRISHAEYRTYLFVFNFFFTIRSDPARADYGNEKSWTGSGSELLKYMCIKYTYIFIYL